MSTDRKIPPLTAEFTKSLPGGSLDDSTFEQIETALDRAEAPCTDEAGKWLTLPERIAGLVTAASADRAEGARLVRALNENGGSIWAKLAAAMAWAGGEKAE